MGVGSSLGMGLLMGTLTDVALQKGSTVGQDGLGVGPS